MSHFTPGSPQYDCLPKSAEPKPVADYGKEDPVAALLPWESFPAPDQKRPALGPANSPSKPIEYIECHRLSCPPDPQEMPLPQKIIFCNPQDEQEPKTTLQPAPQENGRTSKSNEDNKSIEPRITWQPRPEPPRSPDPPKSHPVADNSPKSVVDGSSRSPDPPNDSSKCCSCCYSCSIL